MTSSWLLVTAGFGNENIEKAAYRVRSQADGLDIFDKVLAFTNADLEQACPLVFAKYSDFLNEFHKGFGYMSWKSEICYRALHGHFGDFDGVIWVDAGCEIFDTPWTRIRLKRWLSQTESKGYFLFSLDTPERDFTKSRVFNEFSTLSANDVTPQIQTTWFMLHGEIGREISKRWLDATLKDISMLDLSESPGGEVSTFVEHRNDQSLFSLTIKSMKIVVESYFPMPGGRNLGAQIQAITHPIWVSRNRYGVSIIPSLWSCLFHRKTDLKRNSRRIIRK